MNTLSPREVYSTYLEVPLSKIGVHSYVQKAYDNYLKLRTSDRCKVVFRGTEATFRTQTPNEIKFVHNSLLAEGDILADFLDEIRSDDLVVDIGAHVGTFTCFTQNVLSDQGGVIAFDPNPENYRSLTSNIRLNDGPAEGHCIAMSNQNGTVDVSMPNEGISTISSLKEDSTEAAKVTAQTGDSFFADRERNPNVVKIDVEGAELKVLDGMSETLTHPECRLVYCEVHLVSLPEQGGEPAEVEETLESYGFDCEIINKKEDKTYHVKATK